MQVIDTFRTCGKLLASLAPDSGLTAPAPAAGDAVRPLVPAANEDGWKGF